MEKLTAAKAAKYLGCKVKDLYNDKVGELVGFDLSDENDTPLRVRHNTTWSLHESECLLMLRPLSFISDEDAIEVAKMASNYNEAAFEQNRDYVEMVREDGRDIVRDWNKSQGLPFSIGAQILDFLRSRQYDMDNLIESGIAVKPTR